MKITNLLTAGIGTLFLAGITTLAQMPAPGGQPGLNAALLKLFGDIDAFSAKADVKLMDKAQKQSLEMSMDFALLKGMMRADVDMGQVKSKDVPPAMVEQFKQLGMDKMASIMRPDKKATTVIYPSLRAYADVPMPAEDAADLQKKYQISKSKLGQETVAGHPCQKTRVVVTGEKGERHEATVWYATDLKEFPVQMQMDQGEGAVVMTYRNIRLAKPDAKLFEPPADYTKYETIQAMMQSAMAKMMGGPK